MSKNNMWRQYPTISRGKSGGGTGSDVFVCELGINNEEEVYLVTPFTDVIEAAQNKAVFVKISDGEDSGAYWGTVSSVNEETFECTFFVGEQIIILTFDNKSNTADMTSFEALPDINKEGHLGDVLTIAGSDPGDRYLDWTSLPSDGGSSEVGADNIYIAKFEASENFFYDESYEYDGESSIQFLGAVNDLRNAIRSGKTILAIVEYEDSDAHLVGYGYTTAGRNSNHSGYEDEFDLSFLVPVADGDFMRWVGCRYEDGEFDVDFDSSGTLVPNPYHGNDGDVLTIHEKDGEQYARWEAPSSGNNDGSGNELFLINVTYDYFDENEGHIHYNIDQSYNDITNALNEGKVPCLKYNNTTYNYAGNSTGTVYEFINLKWDVSGLSYPPTINRFSIPNEYLSYEDTYKLSTHKPKVVEIKDENGNFSTSSYWSSIDYFRENYEIIAIFRGEEYKLNAYSTGHEFGNGDNYFTFQRIDFNPNNGYMYVKQIVWHDNNTFNITEGAFSGSVDTIDPESVAEPEENGEPT